MPPEEPTGRDASPPPHAVLIDLATGYWRAQCVYAAAKLGIAELVKDGPRTVEELARSTGTHSRSLYRLLRALASLGVFAEEPDGRFRLTPLAACLLSVPGSQRSLAVMMGEEHFRAWGELLYSLQTGRPAFDRVFGQPVFEYLAAHPRSAEVFDDAMVGIHGQETEAMLEAYDFSGLGTLVDVGGGNGSLLSAVLRRYPSLRGVLFDRDHVVERARSNRRGGGLSERCSAVAGDFFEAVPPGGDAYLLRHIIHDWDDEKSVAILRNCRRAMGLEARLLLVESVIPPGNGPFAGKFLDMNMLVMPGGMERTEAEYRVLLESAGFRLARVVPTRMEVSVVEAKPA